VLFIRGVGPLGYPGAAEVVNMRAPNYLLEKGIRTLACVGDGRQSGTSGSPSILNASPEAAAGGGLALLKNGDKVRIDLNKGEANMLVPEAELKKRREELEKSGGYKVPESQTPWQEIFRKEVDQLSNGMVLKGAVKFQRIASTKGIPRDNH
jgi:dihydroxy-acid dehydratase